MGGESDDGSGGEPDDGTRDTEDDRLSKELLRRAPHPARFTQPQSSQKFTAGMNVPVEFHDGETTADKVKFILRSQSNDYPLGEFPFEAFKATATIKLPVDLPNGAYNLVAKQNSIMRPERFLDVNERHRVRLRTRDTNVISISVNAVDSLSKRFEGKAISERNGPTLRAREPHPAKLITPVASQNLTPGVTFDCHYRDGETTATSLNFLLEDSSGNKTILGETSFSNFEARAAFQCPDLPAGKYTFVIEENSQTNPANFTQAFKIPVNLVDNPTGGSNNSTST
ncbi:hypothetical protein DFH28DRAFT_1083078 [Melampsora americana]|nr:hypothetical protein DFH28DRAFT_1083078 [Melampsora americana]